MNQTSLNFDPDSYISFKKKIIESKMIKAKNGTRHINFFMIGKKNA